MIPVINAQDKSEQEECRKEPDQLFLWACAEQEEQGQQQVELFFDAKRPGVGEGAFFENVQSEILGEGQEAPKRGQLAAFLEPGEGEIKCEDNQVGGNDAKEAFVIKRCI